MAKWWRNGGEMCRYEGEACPVFGGCAAMCVDPHNFLRLIFSNLAETSGFYSAHFARGLRPSPEPVLCTRATHSRAVSVSARSGQERFSSVASWICTGVEREAKREFCSTTKNAQSLAIGSKLGYFDRLPVTAGDSGLSVIDQEFSLRVSQTGYISVEYTGRLTKKQERQHHARHPISF